VILECLVTKNVSASEHSLMGTAHTGMCVHSRVTEVSGVMGWQYVMKVSAIGSRNWLPFVKEHQNTVQ
jgi:hypothetical protein